MCLIRTAREWSHPAVTEDTLLLLAGALAVPYVITSVGIVPYVAGQKGRSGLVWILISLLVSPVIALLALAAMPVTRGDDVLGAIGTGRHLVVVSPRRWRRCQ